MTLSRLMHGSWNFKNTRAVAAGMQRIPRFANVAVALFASLVAVSISGFVPKVMAANPVRIHLDHWANGGSPQTAKKWVDGNIHWTNSHYAEGDADPARFIMDNLQPGTTYTLQFSWLTTKKQGNGGTSVKHAHDFLANYTFSEFPAYTPIVGVPPSGSVFSYPGTITSYPDPCLPRVQGGYKLPYVCAPASAPTSIFEIPADNILGTKANQVYLGGRQIHPQYLSMWNGTINTVSGYTYSPSTNPFNGTGYNSLTVTFTTSSSLASPDGVVLAFGGHLAKAADWGNGQGSADINGAPYHWSYVVVDQSGAKVADGNRDRSIMVLRKGSIEVKKVCQPDDGSSGFLFTSTQPTGVDGLPSSFSLDCNTSQGAIIDGGSGQYSITESPLPGFAVTNISCNRYGADGSSLGPASGLSISPALPVAYPGSVTVNFSYNAADNVICTFTNTKPDANINLSPLTATNEVGKQHEIIATVNQNEGSGPVAAVGKLVTFSLPSNPPGAWFVGGNTCTTDAFGHCSVFINSTNIGTVTIHAITTFSVLGVSLTRATNDGLPGDGSDVKKIYVDGDIGIYPTAVNEVRHEHTFTIKVTQVPDGAAAPAKTADITWNVNPTPSSSSSDCGPSVPFSGNVATCTVTINSGTAGVFTANATATFTIDTATLTRTTDGKGSNSGPATKTYVDANINLSPLTATNEVHDPHTITATVQQNNGTSGWLAAVGKLVTFSLPSNPPGASFVGGNTCTTDASGHCAVTINSNNPGTVVIHATTTFPVLGVSLTRATNDGLPGDGEDVIKIYHSTPRIAVTKTCVSATSGSTIRFFGTITNTGDTDLSLIKLFDNQPAPNTPVPLTQTTLAIGQSMDYTGSYDATSSPSTDTVTVFATDPYTGETAPPASSAPQTCTIPQGTRTLGFWGTHTAFANQYWVPQALCTANNITAIPQTGKNQLTGGFWSDVSKNSDGSSRSALSQARMQLLQQYFAAVLNYRYFKSGSQSQLDAARSAYCGTDVNTILSYVGILDKFNQSGDNQGDTTAAGNATSQDSQTQGNIPFWNNPSFR